MLTLYNFSLIVYTLLCHLSPYANLPIFKKRNSDRETNLQLELAVTLQEKEKEYDEVLSKWKKKLLDVNSCVDPFECFIDRTT